MADDFDDFLQSLPDKLTEKLSPILREQAERLSQAQRAALQALEQSPDETGHLEESCVVVPGSNDLEFIVQAGGELTTKEVRDGSSVPFDYSLGFEFGTSRQPARPFFYSTYNVMRDDMQRAIEDAINEVLND
ncbi:HK97 gp10 family phage protein [Bradyrhizobium diazoefficiens]|uniref:HK97 gp10 family phage protein n=1 Tax=Bradyrhizobium diazoefficiens TaxID=1355477 RepID=UPI0027150613|nr:HK97 gp10 family phage protein [Bradyrhizobium diazoefficiens]WLB42104.1 HK97 gp10 family phage protein [Bradyrhizobium diazoefficiens]